MNVEKKNIQVIAFYLPQFHPISENNGWWGEGFTEWTNVGKAKSLFKNHYQPRIPSDLGYYDLRLPEVRRAQARMAEDAGVFGFCYWHYWFGNGNRLLEYPINEVLRTKEPNFPFCLGWANESWKAKVWGLDHNKQDKLLIEQLYPGLEDVDKHFEELLTIFKDSRYILVENRPLFYIYKPFDHPFMKDFIDRWNYLAKKNGFTGGMFFVARLDNNEDYGSLIEMGFDAVVSERLFDIEKNAPFVLKKIRGIKKRVFRVPRVYSYKNIVKHLLDTKFDIKDDVFPSILPNWDHSPRSGRRAFIVHNSTPELFGNYIKRVFSLVSTKKDSRKIVFLKSWNEWGEGNYMEPDLKFGKKYIEALKKGLDTYKNND